MFNTVGEAEEISAQMGVTSSSFFLNQTPARGKMPWLNLTLYKTVVAVTFY
jgi:hypothetical protein